MNKKPLRFFLLFISAGFFIIWISEIMRTSLAESYWLALLSVVCLLTFQYLRLNEKNKPDQSDPSVAITKNRARSKNKKQ